MTTTKDAACSLIALFAMVGHVDNDGILLLKTSANLVNDGVVVETSVVVVGEEAALAWCQLGTALDIVFRTEMLLALRTADVISRVLT